MSEEPMSLENQEISIPKPNAKDKFNPIVFESKGGGGEKIFKPSWLVETEEELKQLREGKLGTTGKKIAMLHITGLANTLDRNDLTKRAADLGNESVEEGDEVWPETAPYILRMTERIKIMPDVSSSSVSLEKTLKKIGDTLENTAKQQEEQLDYQKQQVELMRRGYNGVILSVEERSAINPEQFFQQVPPWFEQLVPQEKAVIKNMLHINYLAAIKRDNAESWLGELKGLRIERDALEDMKRDMPGFRYALATLQHDIFKQTGEHFVISGTKGDRKKGIVPTGGYAILESESTLRAYKAKKTQELAAFLSEDSTARGYARMMRVSVKDLASVAVSNADNLFFGTGAYDSADEIRALSAGDANVCSEAVRIFFMPGKKGESKWLLTKTEEELQESMEKGTGQEDFGGILGGWIRENALANRNGYIRSNGKILNKSFREGLKDKDIELIPERIFYSLMDHERFADRPAVIHKDQTMAQVLINTGKIRISGSNDEDGIWDFIGGNNAMNFSQLAATDILSDYTDTRGGGFKIFKHITASKQEDILNTDGVINALIKARKDKLVNLIFRNEDLMTACIVMTSTPPGLLRGIPQMILNTPDNLYDFYAFNVTKDPRLFDGLSPDFRERFLKRIHANDQANLSATNILTNIGRGGIIDERRKLKIQAQKNVHKTIN